MFTPEQIQQILNAVITLILTPIIAAVGLFVVTWFKARTSALRQSSKDQEIYKYLDILDTAVYDVVNGLQVELVDDLKMLPSSNGKLTPEDIAEIKDKAIKSITGILGEKGTEILNAVYGDLYKVIDAKIKMEVGEIKKVRAGL